MRAVSGLLALGGASAYLAPSANLGSFPKAAVCSSAKPSFNAQQQMSMISGPRRGGGVRQSPSSIIRSIFMGPGKGKSNSGGLNGNGSGGNKGPPTGPLSASGAADDGKKKAEETGKGLWAAYSSSLDKQPILTKALTSLIGFALGDFLAQKFIDKRESLDLERLARMASFGFLIHGPTGHYFYNWLDKQIPGTEALVVVSKVFIDQVIWNPIFGTLFFGYMGAAEGLSVDAIKDRISNNLWASVKGSWTVWPVAHAINFKFVPTDQRLLYINSIQIGYNMFLSILAKRAGGGAALGESTAKPLKKAKQQSEKASTKTKRTLRI